MFRKKIFVPMSIVVTAFLAPDSAFTGEPLVESQEITDKIEDELFLDPAVHSSKIDVATTEGVVTLSGNVDHLLAKERAARVASTVKGVRSVVNRIEVDPTLGRSDAAIRRDVRDALLHDPAADSYEVDVSVEGGVVTLEGTVDSPSEAQLAVLVAKGVRGVLDLEDDIFIDYATERIDLEIRKDIEESLRWNTYVDHELIDVDVSDGEVTLSGIVGSASEKTLSERIARVAGVDSVDSSELTVERWARDADLRGEKYVIESEEAVEKAIEDALRVDPRVFSFEVTAEVDGQLAILRGTVDNLKAKRSAATTARNTAGVARVRNRIRVRSEEEFEDSEIRDSVIAALERDPYVDRFELTVSAVGGEVYLYGVVDTAFEKNWVDDVAARVAGVTAVNNYVETSSGVGYVYDPYVDGVFIPDALMAEFEPRSTNLSDLEIESAIESEFFWSPFIDSDDVEVEVDEGVARLTGRVDSWSDWYAATENAYEGGATLVDNDIVVTES